MIKTSGEIKAVARRLHQQFWRLIEGKQYASILSSGMAEVVSLNYHDNNMMLIGRTFMWLVTMRDKINQHRYSVELSQFVPLQAMYATFRNAFEPLGVPVDHPYAQAINGDPKANRQDRMAELFRFVPGRSIIVTKEHPVLVGPVDGPVNSAWAAAELRVDANDACDAAKTVIGCNIDPLCIPIGNQPRHGRNRGSRWVGRETGVASALTFYIRIKSDGDYIHIPIARLIGYDPTTGAHTFRLDCCVEELTL